MADDIETSFTAAIDAHKINGAVICATDSKGHFIYNKALGERTLLSGEKRAQQLDDVLYLASATKLITSIAMLQCVEDGLLTLTGDLSSILPELTAKQVLTGFSDDGETPLLQPVKQPINVEMLLTHSSGLSYDFFNPHLVQWRKKFDVPQEGQLRGVEEAFGYPLAFQPGTSWMYGTGLDWAGRVIEQVTGHRLREHVQQRILNPLGLTSAQFQPVEREDLRARLVDLNPQDPQALGIAVSGGDATWNKNFRGDFGGHGLFMSAEDYVKVLHSLLVNDGTLLKPATVDNMFENHLSPDASAGHHTALQSPWGPFFRLGTELGLSVGYGLGGLLTLQDVDGWYRERTMSWGGGISLAWFIDRKSDLCGIGALQPTLPNIDVGAMEVLKQTFRQDIYRKYAASKKEQYQGVGR